MRKLIAALAIMAIPFAAQAQNEWDWDSCDKVTIAQVVTAVHRSDIATLSPPEMIHGTCASEGTLKGGGRIGVRIIFTSKSTWRTEVYTPLANGDPMTNPQIGRDVPVQAEAAAAKERYSDCVVQQALLLMGPPTLIPPYATPQVAALLADSIRIVARQAVQSVIDHKLCGEEPH